MYKPHVPLKEYFYLPCDKLHCGMAAGMAVGGPTSLRECVQSYVVDIQLK